MSASDRDKVMVRGTKRSRDGIRVNRGVRSKAEIKNVCSMVVTIRNTCWMFDNLFHLVGDGKEAGLSSFNISGGGTKPLGVMYIEVTKNEDLSLWVRSKQRFTAQREIVKERCKVG